MKLVLLLSGPIASGKSSVANMFVDQFQFQRIQTGIYLQELAISRGIDSNRRSLQELGDELDVLTDYKWVVDQVFIPSANKNESIRHWVFDCVRKKQQVDYFREKFEKQVFHVHLSASDAELKKRYEARAIERSQLLTVSYGNAINHPNEVASRDLGKIADLIIDVECSELNKIALMIIENRRRYEAIGVN